MRNRIARLISPLVAAAVISAGIFAAPTTAMANTNDTVTSTEISSALNNTNDNLVADPVVSKSDADSAAIVKTSTGTIDVPKDASDGVSLGGSGKPTVSVDLPNADSAGPAKKLADGTVVYPSTNGSANAVIPTDKGVQMLVTITNRHAPTHYTYPIDVSSGGSVQLFNGGAVVQDSNHNDVIVVPPAWAHDADGVSVPTHFETDGTSLTQVVNHTNGHYRYPIVADPFWSTFWAYVGCITGIGAPIGAAIIIAGLPASWPFLYRWAANQSARGDRTIINTINRVHSACSRFMSS